MLVLLVTLAGCDFNPETDNGQVTVWNETDEAVTVRYWVEVETCCGVDQEQREARVDAGSHRRITVDSLFWDGDVQVFYRDQQRTYDLDFNIFGFADVHVRPEDFPAAATVEELLQPLADG